MNDPMTGLIRSAATCGIEVVRPHEMLKEDPHGGAYNTMTDNILLGIKAELPVLIHELSHATWRPERADRQIQLYKAFGSLEYQEEERIAWSCTRHFCELNPYSLRWAAVWGPPTHEEFQAGLRAARWLDANLPMRGLHAKG